MTAFCAEIMQAGLAIETLDGSAFGQKFGPAEDQIFGEIFGVLEAAVGQVMADPGFEFSLAEASQLIYGSTDFFAAVAEKYNVAPGFVKTVAAMGIRTGIGSSFFGHPNGNGQKELAAAVLETLEDGTTGQDVAIKEAVIAIEDIVKFVAEYYDEAYEYAYAELYANGYIDAAIFALYDAMAAVEAFRDALDADDFDYEYRDLINLIDAELITVNIFKYNACSLS